MQCVYLPTYCGCSIYNYFITTDPDTNRQLKKPVTTVTNCYRLFVYQDVVLIKTNQMVIAMIWLTSNIFCLSSLI